MHAENVMRLLTRIKRERMSRAGVLSARTADYLNLQSVAVTKQLAEEVAVEAMWGADSLGTTWLDAGFFLLRFKLLAEILELAVPWELVHELSSLARNESALAIVLEPDEDDSTAVAYLAAKVLNRIRRSMGQRAYLCSAKVVKSSDEIERYREKTSFTGRLSLAGTGYPIAAVLSGKLAATAGEHAKFAELSLRAKQILLGISTRVCASMIVQVHSLDALTQISSGTSLVIREPWFSRPEIILNGSSTQKFRIKRINLAEPGSLTLELKQKE